MHKKNVYVSNSNELRNAVLKEMHKIPYDGNLGIEGPMLGKEVAYEESIKANRI